MHNQADALEFTQYTVLKIAKTRQFYFKDYTNAQWRRVQLTELDFSPRASAAMSMPLADGTLGVEDVTARLH